MLSGLAILHHRSIPFFILFISCFFCRQSFLAGQSQERSLPDPVKFSKKIDIVATAVRAVFEDMEFKIELTDQQGGIITTRPYEFIAGSLTASEARKIADVAETRAENWIRAQYSVEALLEIVSPTQTMVTIHTKIEALNKDIDGTEKWIPLDSLGIIERRLLGKISVKLMEEDAPANRRKGFWGQTPQPVDPRQPKFPTIPHR